MRETLVLIWRSRCTETAPPRRRSPAGRESARFDIFGRKGLRVQEVRVSGRVAYRKALGIEPSHYGVTYRLAGLLLRDHDGRDEALELAQRAAQQSKYSDPASMLVLGRANLATGNVDSAKSAIQIAVKLAVQQGDNELMRIGNNLLSVLKR